MLKMVKAVYMKEQQQRREGKSRGMGGWDREEKRQNQESERTCLTAE